GSSGHRGAPRDVAHARARTGDALSSAAVDTARRGLPRTLARAVAHLVERAGPRIPRARRCAGRMGHRLALRGSHPADLARSTLDADPGDRGSEARPYVSTDHARRAGQSSPRRAPVRPVPGCDAEFRGVGRSAGARTRLVSRPWARGTARATAA